MQVPTCPPSGLGPLQNLDLANFISAPWYAQAMVCPSPKLQWSCWHCACTHTLADHRVRRQLAQNVGGNRHELQSLSMQLVHPEIDPVLCSNQHFTSPPPPCSAFRPCTSPLIAQTYWYESGIDCECRTLLHLGLMAHAWHLGTSSGMTCVQSGCHDKAVFLLECILHL